MARTKREAALRELNPRKAAPIQHSVLEPQAELDIPRLVGLRIAELTVGSAGDVHLQSTEQVPVRDVESGSPEFERSLFAAAHRELLAHSNILTQLKRLPKAGNHCWDIPENTVRRLH